MKDFIPNGIQTMETDQMTYKGKPTNIVELADELRKHGTQKELEADFRKNVKVPFYTTKEKVLQEIKRQNSTLL